jgi:chromosomal replication initiator protein
MLPARSRIEGDGPSIRTIIQVVAAASGVTPIDVRSPRRNAKIVLARHVGMWLASRLTPRSFPTIGQAFGRRDHSSVIYAVRRIDQAMKDDPRFADRVLELAAAIGDGQASELEVSLR